MSNNGFNKNWEWNDKEQDQPVTIKKVKQDVRADVILKLRQKGMKISYSAGTVGLARKILSLEGKKWPGKMNKKAARKILIRFMNGGTANHRHIKQTSENFTDHVNGEN